MLHNNCHSPVYREIVHQSYEKQFLINFILKLAKFENQFETLIKSLVKDKALIWDEDKDACHEFINEISEYFAGNRNWDKGEADESYAAWFKNVAEQIDVLDYKKSNKTGVKIQNLI